MDMNDLKGLYIAHRGIHNDKVIENTISSFSLALEKRVPIELDIQILKDGNIVVYHDKNLKRLMNIDRKLSSYTYDELKQLTFPNTEQHIPLLQEVLELIDGKALLVIEIKSSDIVSYREYGKKIVSILKDYPYDFVIKSFDIRIINWFLHHTKYIAGLLIAKRNNSFYDWIMQKKITVSILKPDFISVDYHIVSSKMVQEFRKEKPVLVWTIRNEETLDLVKDKADSFLIEKFYF